MRYDITAESVGTINWHNKGRLLCG